MMSDSCQVWRGLLSERADGQLTAERRVALENHLKSCAECREAEAADTLLSSALTCTEYEPMSAGSARAFDDRMIARMKAEQPLSHRIFGWARERTSALPIDMMRQVAGGALIAASLTVICLCTSLNALISTPSTPHGTIPAAARTEMPVPLETLLRVSEPRAALLWSNPTASGHGTHGDMPSLRPIVRPVPVPNTSSHLPGRHSSIGENANLS